MRSKQKGGKKVKKEGPKKIHVPPTFPWDVSSEVQLYQLICKYKPIGPFKHWKMRLLRSQLSKSLGIEISCETIWAKLDTLFDIKEIERAQFPPPSETVEEFTLPKNFLASPISIVEKPPSSEGPEEKLPEKLVEVAVVTELLPSLSPMVTPPPRKNKRKGYPRKSLIEFSPTITSDECESVPIVIEVAPVKTLLRNKKPPLPSPTDSKMLRRRAKIDQLI